MLRFLCPLYANKSHQWHILLRITGYKWGGTRLVTRYVATVRHSPRGTRVTVITCLTPHTVNVLCVLFIFCHCWLTRMAPQQMVQVSLHTGVYCTTGSLHGCILWLVVWPGRGRPRHWPSVDSPLPGPALTAAPPPSAPRPLVTSLHRTRGNVQHLHFFSSTVNDEKQSVLTHLVEKPFIQSFVSASHPYIHKFENV